MLSAETLTKHGAESLLNVSDFYSRLNVFLQSLTRSLFVVRCHIYVIGGDLFMQN